MRVPGSTDRTRTGDFQQRDDQKQGKAGKKTQFSQAPVEDGWQDIFNGGF